MSTTFTVPEGFHLVGASLLAPVFVLVGQSAIVGKWRKRSGIAYPQLYAEKAEAAASQDAFKFNCAQRAHQNTLENLPVIYTTTILTGLKYPCFAAAACFVWSVSRIFYTRGYLSEPKKSSKLLFYKRNNFLSLSGTLSLLGLLLASTFTVGQTVLSHL
ncbi:hypothetical protein H0H92_013632 [Tricholoma furcatifolium]|nr:hypothetical protein H0H92_013632 [Tricholoma furcatifolium]